MIHTLLDNDFYQFTMSQCVWAHGHKDWQVRYEFRNRTFAVPLANRLDLSLLRWNVEQVRALRFSDSDLDYLDGLGYFDPAYLEYLETVRLPEVRINSANGHLVLEYEGDWSAAIFWETPLLAIVNEMYYGQFTMYEEGARRFDEKISYLKDRGTIKFVEFGTRRRFSQDWQETIMAWLLNRAPEMVLGTSNVNLAKEYDITPVGTMAHQLFMVNTAFMAAVDREIDPIVTGAERTLKEWAAVYSEHDELMTALPDTYTTDAFFERVSNQTLEPFKSFRQDSGDPLKVGQKLARFAKANGGKVIFSDSLDVRRMSVIEDHFPDTEIVFGWGTNLTNDLGYEPLSIVIKPCAVQPHPVSEWLPCIKLSDDVAKATGDPSEIKRYTEEAWWRV